ncbi:MAG: phage terminase large subunit, partial [Terricaulis sp.]
MNSIDNRLLHAALDQALREDFQSFARKAFGVVSPDAPFAPNWHFNAIAHALERCLMRKTKRLLITVPPRSGKSILCSAAFPAFILGRDPTQRIICASYSNDLAAKFGRDTRTLMQTPWYQRAFSETRLDKQTETEVTTTFGGARYATSVGGTVTGRGGNTIIVDDAMKPEDALSEAKRSAALEWFDATLASRLDDKENGVIIVVMQRLAVEDLAGHVLNKGNYTHLNLPAIALADQAIATDWGQTYQRKAGELLHPERVSREALEQIKKDIGTFTFSAQYQQEPVPEDGELIKWKWFQLYDERPAPEEHDRIVQSWDTAMTAGFGSDYSVCTTWLTRGNHFYLLDVLREKLDFPSLKSRAINHYKAWRANTLLIENKGSGQSLVQDLRHTPHAPQPIAINVKDDKTTRLVAVSVMIESQQVFLPRTAPWLAEFKSELLQFPNGKHDDQV